MKVNECKLIQPVTCNKKDSIVAVSKKFKEKKLRYLVVLDGEKPVGAISTSDIVTKVIAENKNINLIKAEDIMNSPLFYLKGDEEINIALVAMVKKGLNMCPVIYHNKYIGTLTILELITRIHKK